MQFSLFEMEAAEIDWLDHQDPVRQHQLEWVHTNWIPKILQKILDNKQIDYPSGDDQETEEHN